MMRALGLTVLLLGAVACGNDTKPPVQATPTPVQAEPDPEPAAPDPPVEEPASEQPDPPADDTCQAECVQRNQMRAVAPEQIEADCAAECAASSDSP
jgi:hypothetical protein